VYSRNIRGWLYNLSNEVSSIKKVLMENLLSGKVAIITGASSGIGAACAYALSRLNCKLTLAARSEDKLRHLVAKLGEEALAASLGNGAIAVRTDVTRPDEVEAMVKATMDAFGRVDILLANAGIYLPGQLVDQPDAAQWANVIETNVNGVLYCMHAVLPHMTAQKSGDIIVTSSISGFMDIVWEPIYSASKHAVQGLVHTFRRQLAPHGIRVGSIAPGTVANELWGFTDPQEIKQRVAAHTALSSEDVAEAVVFMLSRERDITISDLVMLPQLFDV
jgi:ribitol 2-dehydrogenase